MNTRYRRHVAEAERLAGMAHHHTYGDGEDATVGQALATEALAQATLAQTLVLAALLEAVNTCPHLPARVGKVVGAGTAHPEEVAARAHSDAG
ncbi:hypothetical protein ACIRL2_45870 [Embleya sp. NPDC127516]|uniref:hypothetical protein n=1 Tax=Embleya sp. NPDC127516 TaxID=3363990 RepID=UPI00381D737B